MVLQGGATYAESALVGFELNQQGTETTVVQRVTTKLAPHTLGFDAEGNWIVVEEYTSSLPPVTAGSRRLPPGYGQAAFLRLSATGSGVLSATVLQDQGANSVVTGPDGTLYITTAFPYATPLHPEISGPEPVSIAKPAGSYVLYAYPKIVESCTTQTHDQNILWDWRGDHDRTTWWIRNRADLGDGQYGRVVRSGGQQSLCACRKSKRRPIWTATAACNGSYEPEYAAVTVFFHCSTCRGGGHCTQSGIRLREPPKHRDGGRRLRFCSL